MKKIKLTRGKYALVDDEDFEQINRVKWHLAAGKYAGRRNKREGAIYMHRVINKTPIGMDTDHINRNKLDNRRINLRSVSRPHNMANTGPKKNNTSGIKGVYFDKARGLWSARIHPNKVAVFLGRFKNKKEAMDAYNKAARKYYGEFALLNI